MAAEKQPMDELSKQQKKEAKEAEMVKAVARAAEIIKREEKVKLKSVRKSLRNLQENSHEFYPKHARVYQQSRARFKNKA